MKESSRGGESKDDILIYLSQILQCTPTQQHNNKKALEYAWVNLNCTPVSESQHFEKSTTVPLQLYDLWEMVMLWKKTLSLPSHKGRASKWNTGFEEQ
jgi:hypothetical protein